MIKQMGAGVTAVRGREKKTFSQTVWDNMPKNKYGWKVASSVPEELQGLSDGDKANAEKINAAKALLDSSRMHLSMNEGKLPEEVVKSVTAENAKLDLAIQNNDYKTIDACIVSISTIMVNAVLNAQPKQVTSSGESESTGEAADKYAGMTIDDLRAEITKRSLTYPPAAKEAGLTKILVQSDNEGYVPNQA